MHTVLWLCTLIYHWWHCVVPYQDGIKLLNTWLEGERSYSFCKFLGQNTAKLRPDEVPHCKIKFFFYKEWNLNALVDAILIILSKQRCKFYLWFICLFYIFVGQLKHGLFSFLYSFNLYHLKYLRVSGEIQRWYMQRLLDLSCNERKMLNIQVSW